MKTCLDCKQEKQLEEFAEAPRGRQGRNSYCRPCMAVRSRESYRKRQAAQGVEVRPHMALPAGLRRCSDCREVKDLAEFPNSKNAPTGKIYYCRPCHNARGRRSVQQNHGSTRTYHLKRRYGLTAADVDQMIEAQGGTCALCRQRTPTHVDHDHVTGAVRGVLCSGCNQGLGNFRDDAAALCRAIDYLETTTWQRTPVCTGVYRLTTPRRAAPPSSSSSALQHLIYSRRGASSPRG